MGVAVAVVVVVVDSKPGMGPVNAMRPLFAAPSVVDLADASAAVFSPSSSPLLVFSICEWVRAVRPWGNMSV